GEGRMLPDFETATTDIMAGETRTFALTFPADYHGKEVAGKVAHFTLTAKEVTEPHVPPLDDAFAKTLGISSGNVQELRDQVEAMVQEVAKTYEQPEAVVRWHFEKRERLAEFEALAVEQNVVDWVLARARVNDVSTTFEALMTPANT